ncbi:MAG: DUF2079 domain-containing protein [Clostridiales bacterium]|nr:DUF2079 domain-containing protein [Clostridiales bacterium]
MVEPFFVIFITLCLFFVTNCQAENIYYALISSAVMGGLIFYYTGRMKSFDLSKKVTILLCTIFGTLFVLFVGGLTILRYLNHWTPNFDFGIFSQMFYYMKETLIPYTTTERDRLLSHFAVHFSPIYYLILPIYMVFPSPATLLAVQAIAIALGIIPLYKLGKHYNLRNWAITLLVGVYVLFPALIGGNFYYFHENKLLTVLLLWLFYFIEKERNIPTAIFAVLVLMVKEDAPIYVAFIGLYILLSRRGAIRGTSLLGGSVIYFLVVTKLMTQYGEGIMSNRYNNYIFDPKGGLLSVVVNIIKNPAYLFTQILTEEKLIFLIYMFVPLAMIPLAIKKPSRIILILPLVLINIMPNYIYQYNIGYQYTYGSSAFLFYLAIMNLGEISPPISKRLLLSALAASMIFFAATHTDRINYVKSYIESREQIKAINEGLALIPKDKSVKACTFLVTPLSDRKVIYQYEYTKHTTEYVVLDLRYSTSEYNINDYRNSRYDEIYFVEGTIAIFRLKEPVD